MGEDVLYRTLEDYLVRCEAGNGAPGGIRTPYLLIRSQTLYPDELQAQIN